MHHHFSYMSHKHLEINTFILCFHVFHKPPSLLALGPWDPAYDVDWFITTLWIFPNLPKYSCFFRSSGSARRTGSPTTNTKLRWTTLTLAKCFLFSLNFAFLCWSLCLLSAFNFATWNARTLYCMKLTQNPSNTTHSIFQDIYTYIHILQLVNGEPYNSTYDIKDSGKIH